MILKSNSKTVLAFTVKGIDYFVNPGACEDLPETDEHVQNLIMKGILEAVVIEAPKVKTSKTDQNV